MCVSKWVVCVPLHTWTQGAEEGIESPEDEFTLMAHPIWKRKTNSSLQLQKQQVFLEFELFLQSLKKFHEQNVWNRNPEHTWRDKRTP